MKNRWVIIGGAAVILIFVWLGFLKGRQANANARPVKNISAQKLYEQAVNMKNNRDLLPAKEIYQKILTDPHLNPHLANYANSRVEKLLNQGKGTVKGKGK